MRRQGSPGKGEQTETQEPTTEGRGPGGARDPERRKTEPAEDQDPIEEDVDQIGEDDYPNDRLRPTEGLKTLPKDNEEEEWQHPGRETDAVGRRQGHDVSRLAKVCEDRLGCEEQDRRGNREQSGENHSALYAARNRGCVARAHRLGHDRIEHHQRAHAEDRGNEEVQVAQRDGGECLGRTGGRP